MSGSLDGGVKLWEVSTGREVKTFSHESAVFSVSFSPDGKHIVSGESSGKIGLWDISSDKEVKILKGHEGPVYSVSFSPDGDYVVSGGADKKVKLWDIKKGKEIRTYEGHKEVVTSVSFSPDGRFILSSSRDSTFKLWLVNSDLDRNLMIATFVERRGFANSVSFSPDGKLIASAVSHGECKISLWETGVDAKVRKLRGGRDVISSISFSSDGKYIVSAGFTVRLWDITNASEIKAFKGHSGEVLSVSFSPDGKYIASVGLDNKVKLWDVNNGEEVKKFEGDKFFEISFSPGYRYIAAGGLWGITFWEVSSGRELATFIGFTDGEWVVITPEGYFNTSQNGTRHLNVRVRDSVYSMDKFYEKFYNPVYVASILRGEQVKAYADIRKGVLPPPEVTIIFPQSNMEFETDTITIIVSAKDVGGGIDEVRLYHNEKVVGEDVRGIKLISSGNEVIKYYSVRLVDGINTFRAIGYSKDRTESEPYEVSVKFSSVSKDISLYVFSVGINEYKNSSLNLNYAKPDARAIAEFFKQTGSELFNRVETMEIYNSEATKDNIISRLGQLKETNPRDVVIIYLAGHGETIDDKWYFIPHEVIRPEREDEVKSNGISSDEFSRLISGIKAQKVLVLIDACKSGAMLIAFRRALEDRRALLQLSRATGIHVIAASTREQFATEVKDLGHGVFTYTILERLKGKASGGTKIVTVRKLMAYVEEAIA